ncbi:MAG: disulfide bond formation protein B [Gammaproteobacteria bacterium]
MFSSRLSYIGAFAVCVAVVTVALYLQYVQGVEPCPLCMIQRVLVIAIGLVCLAAAIHAPAFVGRRVYGTTVALVALLGAAVAMRHLWLQSLPSEQAPACGPGLEYILEHFPWDRALKLVILGSGECSEVLWTFLGLSLPAWTLMAFMGLFAFGLIQAWLPLKHV